MNSWRKKGDKYNQELPRLKPHNYYGKPPLGGNSNWQQSVPSWEKRFVTSVGTMSWKKFLEAKRYAHLYDNIMKWDDCAGEEAFRTAKDNFHAKVHGLPCDIKPHDPDLYIDKIDWNGEIDHNLILDLDSDYVVPDSDSDREPVVIFGDALPDPYKNYSPGWGDEKTNGVCQNEMPDVYNNGISYDDYVNNWDVDFGDFDPQWFSNGSDNKAQGDQGWKDDNKDYEVWNNNNHHGNDNNAQGDQDWKDDKKDYESWNNNNCYGNDNNAQGVQGWKDEKNDYEGWNNNNFYGNDNNAQGDQGWKDDKDYESWDNTNHDGNDNNAQGDQGWKDEKKDYGDWNNNNYYGNDNKAQGDQGWKDDKKDYVSWNNNNYHGNDNNAQGDQGWEDDKKNYGGWNNNNYYGNDNNAQGDQGWKDDKKDHESWYNNNYYGNDNNAQGDQVWKDDKKNYGGWNNNNYYGNVNNGGGRYKNWRFNGVNDGSWRNNGNRRKQVVQAHGSQWVHGVHP